MIKILVRNRLKSVFGSIVGRGKGGTVKKASTAKKVGMALLYLYVILTFASFAGLMAFALGKSLLPVGLDWLYFAIFILASLAIVFILSVFETKSELFECKDNELLLSMPIKPRDIVVARIAVVLIYNYLEELLIMLPCIIAYMIYAPSAVGFIGLLLMILLLPLISTALSAAVGYAVALIAKKLKKNSFIILAISLAFFFAYLFGYNAIFENFTKFIENASEGAVSDLPFLYYIGSAVLLKPASILIMAGAAILLSVIAYILISRSYIGIVSDTSAGQSAEYKERAFKQKNALWALVVKEMRKFKSSATYMLNAGIGLIMALVFAVYAIIKPDIIASLATILSTKSLEYSVEALLSPLAIIALVLMVGLNIMSACALSLEGKSFWILKTMPISARTALLSKALPQIIVSTPPTLISSVLLIIAVDAPVEYWAFYILTPFFANLFTAFLGVIINVAFPNFDFDNETKPIKQSLSVFLVTMINMFISALIFIGSWFLLKSLSPLILSVLSCLIFALLAVITLVILLGVAAKRYDKLSA